jgi:hypothetical protein
MQILTPSGFQPFEGVARYWHDKSLKFVFEEGNVESAYDHRFIINGKEVLASDVKIGDNIGKTVKDIIEISEGDYFYDPVNVSNGKIYNHDNGFVSHNTFFGTGNTLISADALMNMKAASPLADMGDVKVYEEPKKNHDYIMTVDVAKGRGQDYSTFNIIDISTNPFKQVACYRNNMISPILFPDIIHKWAKRYNEAYAIIESNDAGSVVANGLYYDIEYENVHVESMIKAGAIGMTMNRKVKRIGCSNLKDLVEEKRLELVDLDTISECSTFEARGNSFEASDGNHDDLVMNLVMFAWYVGSEAFVNQTDMTIKQMLYEQRNKEIEDDIVPVGIIDDGVDRDETEVVGGDVWTSTSTEMF